METSASFEARSAPSLYPTTAQDPRLKRRVAIKLLPPDLTRDETAKQRFLQEAQAASALDHPNICTIHEINETDDGRLYLVMAHYEGETLQARIGRGPLPLDDAVDIATQVGTGLAEAHGAGIVHRDIKPANLLVSKSGVVKILDFGLAKLAGTEGLTQTGTAVGTVAYMSPEQARGQEVDHRTDIWSLGVVLYEMLAGEPPFRGENLLAMAAAIRQDSVPELPGDSTSLGHVVRRALSKEPTSRYRAVGDFLDDLAHSKKTKDSREVPAPHRTGIESVAVLPLANLSRDPDQQFFADGMTEALITDLAKMGALKVISRTSVMRYKGSDQPLPEIARELGVDAIVEGSVLRAGDQVRITAQLIHAASDSHMWAESYDRDLTNILSLQSEIARAVAAEVRVQLTSQQQAHLADKHPVDPAAHEAYLRGRYFWNQRGPGLQKSITHFEQALAHDGNYAPAHAGLADAYALLGFYGYAAPNSVFPEGKKAARRALAIDETLAEAHASLGYIHTIFDWASESPPREFQRALALNPGYVPARYWYATWLINRGFVTEAIDQVQRGLACDPLSVYLHTHLAVVLVIARRLTDASVAARKALELDPAAFVARTLLGLAYHFQSRCDDAIRELQQAVDGSGGNPWPLGTLGTVYAANGHRRAAGNILAELTHRARSEYIDAVWPASVHALLGETDEAFSWLGRGIKERSALVSGVEHSLPAWAFEGLAADGRYQDFIRRIDELRGR